MAGDHVGEDSADFGGELIDVSQLSLHDLDAIGSSVLGQALGRLLDPEQKDERALSGFQAVI
jgi:FXSXX-COOH protein